MTDLAVTVETMLRETQDALRASAITTVANTPEQVTDLLRAGEDVVAYETLCANLYEDGIAVPPESLRELRQAAQRAGADLSWIEPLFD